MKPATRTIYEDRMSQVVDHVYTHLDDSLDLDRLADIACMSAFHWHRVYQAMRGETIAATVKRLRLQRAADRLAHSEEPPERIARQCGYSGLPAFTRAFKAAYGMTPAKYREQGPHQPFMQAQRDGDGDRFDVRVQDLAAIDCVSLLHTGPYLNIGAAFEQLFSAVGSAGALTNDSQMMAVFLDDPDLKDEAQLQSLACASAVPAFECAEPFVSHEIPAGPHAVLRHVGPYPDMRVTYQWLYGQWLPASGFEAADQPGYEIYLNSPKDTPPAELMVDICLPLAG